MNASRPASVSLSITETGVSRSAASWAWTSWFRPAFQPASKSAKSVVRAMAARSRELRVDGVDHALVETDARLRLQRAPVAFEDVLRHRLRDGLVENLQKHARVVRIACRRVHRVEPHDMGRARAGNGHDIAGAGELESLHHERGRHVGDEILPPYLRLGRDLAEVFQRRARGDLANQLVGTLGQGFSQRRHAPGFGDLV